MTKEMKKTAIKEILIALGLFTAVCLIAGFLLDYPFIEYIVAGVESKDWLNDYLVSLPDLVLRFVLILHGRG